MKKDVELQNLIKEGNTLLKLIKKLDDEIDNCKDGSTLVSLTQSRTEAQRQFNEIFDKVFSK
jgi:uncharacterized protein Yka (UPF0111/DUF47 family)